MADERNRNDPDEPSTTWGPKLFGAVLLASLVFFWWLLIYGHGVPAGHG